MLNVIDMVDVGDTVALEDSDCEILEDSVIVSDWEVL